MKAPNTTLIHLTPVGGGRVRTSFCGVVCAPESDETRAITGHGHCSSNRAHANCPACFDAAPEAVGS
jgi:hypothetical protein